MGTLHRLQKKHERIWEDEVDELLFQLLAVHGIRGYQDTDPENVVKFYGIKIHRLLKDKGIDDLLNLGSTNCYSMVLIGTPGTSTSF